MDSSANRLIDLGRRKAALTSQLAKVHAEECSILSGLLQSHGAAAGEPKQQ
jgi:hypothetical protein